ncbi:hypothetical protein [uncultured Shewanella sp.]|uniref:hypothetical protein n=1 Tax=uncultured Shewanella sp. TaxID=173975 RepID=UPI00261046E9|nr:hypothetical protein [uncultured Shewanella sp.]
MLRKPTPFSKRKTHNLFRSKLKRALGRINWKRFCSITLLAALAYAALYYINSPARFVMNMSMADMIYNSHQLSSQQIEDGGGQAHYQMIIEELTAFGIDPHTSLNDVLQDHPQIASVEITQDRDWEYRIQGTWDTAPAFYVSVWITEKHRDAGYSAKFSLRSPLHLPFNYQFNNITGSKWIDTPPAPKALAESHMYYAETFRQTDKTPWEVVYLLQHSEFPPLTYESKASDI